MSLEANGSGRWGFQASTLITLLSSLWDLGVLEPSNRTRLPHRRKPCGLEQLTNPSGEILLGFMSTPLHEEAIMDTNSSLSQRLILALTSDAGNLDSATQEWTHHALSPKQNISLCFQTSVLTLLAHKPSRLGILEPPRSTMPAHQKEKLPYGVA